MRAPEPLAGELRVLERMLGVWDEVVIYQPAIMNPGGQTVTSLTRKTAEFAGHFLYMAGTWQPPGTDYLNVVGYDPFARRFRMWYFDATGAFSPAPMTGEWNEPTHTITWRSTDAQGNVSMGTHTIVSADRNEWTMVSRTAGGELLMDAAGTLTRHRG